jgi:hypothetical protein
MPFIRIEGFAGRIFVPETVPARQKHKCTDCFSCQFCSDDRCTLCLRKNYCNKNAGPGEEKKSGS